MLKVPLQVERKSIHTSSELWLQTDRTSKQSKISYRTHFKIPQVCDDESDQQTGMELSGGHHSGRGEVRGLHVQPPGHPPLRQGHLQDKQEVPAKH